MIRISLINLISPIDNQVLSSHFFIFGQLNSKKFVSIAVSKYRINNSLSYTVMNQRM